MYCLGPILFLLIALQPWRTADAACCYSTYTRFKISPGEDCNNYLNSSRYWFTDSCYKSVCNNLEKPTPCCGIGECNFFCCNCDDGCHPGKVVPNLKNLFGDKITMITPEQETIIKVPR